MEKIASFTIDHLKLQPGVYVSRKDTIGAEVITTFDLRMTSPNNEPVMNTAEMHTIEHLAATFLRNHPLYKEKTIYFGPMGCRTGFYLLLAGDLTSGDIVSLMIEMFEFIRDYCDEVPGASAVFRYGWVTYCNEAKERLLGVPAALIEEHSVVSEPVVAAMATAAMRQSGADIAVAVSGNAGPTAAAGEPPVGTVCLAIARRGAARPMHTETLTLPGLTRRQFRERVTAKALQLIAGAAC